jgi:hypothetical protein
MSRPSSITEPAKRADRTCSCIRLRVRRKVDLPHPEGPMSEVTWPAGIVSETRSSTLWSPNQAVTSRASREARERGGAGGALFCPADQSMFLTRSARVVRGAGRGMARPAAWSGVRPVFLRNACTLLRSLAGWVGPGCVVAGCAGKGGGADIRSSGFGGMAAGQVWFVMRSSGLVTWMREGLGLNQVGKGVEHLVGHCRSQDHRNGHPDQPGLATPPHAPQPGQQQVDREEECESRAGNGPG